MNQNVKGVCIPQGRQGHMHRLVLLVKLLLLPVCVPW